VKRVPVEKETALKRCRPAGLDKLKVAIFGRSVDFVADDGMTDVRNVNPDLMRSAGERLGLDNRELFPDATVPG
jgi:hypothetical protein